VSRVDDKDKVNRRGLLLGGVSALVLNTLLFRPAKPQLSTPYGTQNPQTGISANPQSGVSMGAGLPPAMVSNPPDIYVNMKTNQAVFRNSQVVPATQLVSVSRASPATQVNASGVWSTFLANQHAMTDLGHSIWEARTNSIRNNAMAGAAAGSPGTLPTNWGVSGFSGLTQTIVGTGNTSGIDYIDIQFSGTTSGTTGNINFESTTQIAATYGQTWSASAFLAVTGGDFTNVSAVKLAQIENTSGGALVQTDVGSDVKGSLTGTIARFSYSATLGGATTAKVQPGLQFTLTNSAAVNFTIRIGWPQLENNSLINSTVASAVMAASGTGGVNGSAVYSVGGGAGPTTATLNVTWAAGVMTVNSVANAGSYTTFPPSPSTLTYVSGTATGWTGATVTLTPTDLHTQAAASNPILTTSAAVTRNSEADTLVLTGLPGFGSAYTVYARITPQTPTGYPNPQFSIQVDDGTATNRAFLRREASTGSGTWRGFGGAGWNISATALTQSASVKLAGAATTSDQAYYDNAAQVGTASAATLPSGLNTVHLGVDAGTVNQVNGNLEEFAIWFTQRLPNATLQAITT
jgi:hypothetical protein